MINLNKPRSPVSGGLRLTVVSHRVPLCGSSQRLPRWLLMDPQMLEVLTQWFGVVVTGAVGLAGVLGVVWTSHRERRLNAVIYRASLVAEDKRIALTDKRRIYAAFLAQLSTLSRLRAELQRPFDKESMERKAVVADVMSALERLNSLLYEILLIAPDDVMTAALLAQNDASDRATDALKGSLTMSDPDLREDLITLMRNDLEASRPSSIR